MSTQDTPIFLPQESIPGSTEHHSSARVEDLTSPQVMATSAAAVSGTVCHDLPLGGLGPKSPHGSPDTSMSSQILGTSAVSGVTMRRNLSQPRNSSSSGSSGSDELGGVVDMAFMYERAKNFHLEQQLAQTLHMLESIIREILLVYHPPHQYRKLGTRHPCFLT
jgi:hypothetical protein